MLTCPATSTTRRSAAWSTPTRRSRPRSPPRSASLGCWIEAMAMFGLASGVPLAAYGPRGSDAGSLADHPRGRRSRERPPSCWPTTVSWCSIAPRIWPSWSTGSSRRGRTPVIARWRSVGQWSCPWTCVPRRCSGPWRSRAWAPDRREACRADRAAGIAKARCKPSPLPTYSALGGLRQAPGHDAESSADVRITGELELRMTASLSTDGLRANGVFNLPDRLSVKAAPTLIAGDERHFTAVAATLAESIAELSNRLEAESEAAGRPGQDAMERDSEIHRLTARLRPAAASASTCASDTWSRGDPNPSTSDGSGSGTRPAVDCSSTGARRRLSRSSPRPTPTRWVWRAVAVPVEPRPDHRLLGRGVHSRRARTPRRAR